MLPPLATTSPEIHHRYEARLSKCETGSGIGKQISSLPHRTSRRTKHIYSDRFIPSRVGTKLDAGFELTSPTRYGQQNNQNHHGNDTAGFPQSSFLQSSIATPSNPTSSAMPSTTSSSKTLRPPTSRASYSMLLKSELLGIHPSDNSRAAGAPPSTSASSFVSSAYDSPVRSWSSPASAPSTDSSRALSPLRPSTARTPSKTEVLRPGCSASNNLLRFKAPRQSIHDEVKTSMSVFGGGMGGGSRMRSLYGSAGDAEPEPRRKIARTPFKVLDAPALQDDFYLNLVDWSASNVVAVGLGASVFLWSACTSKVTKLCDLSEIGANGAGDTVTSVAWSQRGGYLSIGTNSGDVQLWDVTAGKRVRTMPGHVARVGTLAWGATAPGTTSLLASGSRDRTILLRDPRSSEAIVSRLAGHRQEVCGLKWSFDGKQLASGGNDNKLCIWSVNGARGGINTASAGLPPSTMLPVARFSEHTAAVKAIAWSPHQHGLLASGGGTADRCIRFWNTQSMTALGAVDTGSQVCNLVWAKTANEVVSTHGYSLNQIIVWKYPSMDKLATLTGHRLRVLYLAMSPDGQTIVTGAGDETLRFWNAFPSAKASGSRWAAGSSAELCGKLGKGVVLPLGIGSEIR